MKEASYYQKKGSDRVQCLLCPHRCVIKDGDTGLCLTRRNRSGVLYSLVYDRYLSVAMDPMEKKPLYHFYPGTGILSIGTAGCNLKCGFCQNHELSQSSPEDLPLRQVPAGDLVAMCKQYSLKGIAYTYNEPLINYEYVLECSMEARKYGLKNVLVTNGYINEQPLANLLPYIDAANVDVKSFRDAFYKENCSAGLSAVLRTVEIMVRAQKHVELTTLIIHGLNDGAQEIEDLCDWISSLSRSIPLHLSRYFPRYRFKLPPTPYAALSSARKTAAGRLDYVYIGNAAEDEKQNTFCPSCGSVLIERSGYDVRISGIKEGACLKCRRSADVVL